MLPKFPTLPNFTFPIAPIIPITPIGPTLSHFTFALCSLLFALSSPFNPSLAAQFCIFNFAF